MTVLIVILTVTALGLAPAIAIDRGHPPAALLGLGFLYGCGLVYLVLLVQSIAGLRWSLIVTIAMATLVSAAALFLAMRGGAPPAPPARPPWSWIDLATAGLLAAYASYVTVTEPFNRDFWTIWGLKGRVFFESRGIDWQFLASPLNRTAQPDYPLLLPFNYSLAAMAGGGWDDRWLGLFSFAFGASLLLIIRAAAAREATRPVAATITFAAAAFALAPQAGLAEGPLIAYGTAGLVMLRRAVITSSVASMRHAALLLGFAAVTKNEGMTLCAGALAACVVARVPSRLLRSLWPMFILIGSWIAVRAIHALPTDLATAGALDRVLLRLKSLLALLSALMTSISSPLLWLALIAGLVIARPRELRRETVLLIAVVVQLTFIVSAYLVTPYDAAWHVETSWSRISRQLGAPLVFAVMMALSRTFSKEEGGTVSS